MRVKLAFLSLPLLLLPVVADDPEGDAKVIDAIDKGREAFKAGKSQEAIDQLQKAINLIQATAMKNLATFLPARDEKEWELGEIEKQSGNWGTVDGSFQWSQVQRHYKKKGADDGPEVNVMISNSPQIVEGTRAAFQMFKDPAMRAIMNQDPDQKVDVIEDNDGWLGMVTTRKESCTIMALHEKLLVQIEVQPGDENLAKEFWTAIDRKGLGGVTK